MRLIRAVIAFLALLLAAPAFADPVTAPPSQNFSGTITTGGTFQQVVPSAYNTRKGCLVMNPPSATENLYVFFGPAASATTSNSIGLTPNSWASCAIGPVVVGDAIQVEAPTTSHAYIAVIQ